MSRWLILGHISGIYGVKGWVKVFSETEPRDNIFNYQPWYLHGEAWQVEQGRRQGKTLVAKLVGCDDREAARQLIGTPIAIKREQLGELEADEFFWADLEGLAVKNRQGYDFGRVHHLFATGANDVMVVRGDRERLIPWLWQQVILEVNQDEGWILVDWDADF